MKNCQKRFGRLSLLPLICVKKLIVYISSYSMVKFSSDDEKKVFEELTKIDMELGNIYYAGLLVLRQKDVQIQVSENTLPETTGKEDSQTESSPLHKNL